MSWRDICSCPIRTSLQLIRLLLCCEENTCHSFCQQMQNVISLSVWLAEMSADEVRRFHKSQLHIGQIIKECVVDFSSLHCRSDWLVTTRIVWDQLIRKLIFGNYSIKGFTSTIPSINYCINYTTNCMMASVIRRHCSGHNTLCPKKVTPKFKSL